MIASFIQRAAKIAKRIFPTLPGNMYHDWYGDGEGIAQDPKPAAPQTRTGRTR